jgi:hypothetical protein
MSQITKHFQWDNGKYEEYLYGRVAVAVTLGGTLRIEQVAGPAMPARMLPDLLAAALSTEIVSEANDLHANRKNPHAVEVRRGISGCVDYLLRSLYDEQLNDAPIAARIHISMYGKLNEPINIWLGDLPPLFQAMSDNREFYLDDDEVETDGEILFNVEEVPQYEGEWMYTASERIVIGEKGLCSRKDDSATEKEKYLSAETLNQLRELKFQEEK